MRQDSFICKRGKMIMVDFKKKLNAGKAERVVEPCELYSTLDRKSVAGPLRTAQEYILKKWYEEHREDRDLIIKLHTGDGKTLVGLLILQSVLNAQNGPCIYVCPNIYLAKQVCEEAEKFGIPFCIIDENNEVPDEFLSGQKILITHAQKVFNGKTKFGVDNNFIHVDAIVLDDSHACIDTIRASQTITIKKQENEALYKRILGLFEDDLIEQREGSYLDVQSGSRGTIMSVPYWSFYDKRNELLRILSESNNINAVQFAWPIMRDRIKDYGCYISGTVIEIVPHNPSVDIFGTFSQAKHRILMSATTQDDAFFIKGLSFDSNAVMNPLMYEEQKWSGEKMIIFPSMIDERCDRELVVTEFSKMTIPSLGMVAIVPNSVKQKQYNDIGAICVNSENIYSTIESLKKKEFSKLVVINNRYDGIDLPDEACRVLILDSMPFFKSLADCYEEKCRPSSEVINKKLAQRIEQGLGRGVRGEKDYCAILIIGSDLVKFMRSKSTKKYFSLQTQKQIDIGLQVAEWAVEDIDEDKPMKPVYNLLTQMLQRDAAWKEYYSDSMQSIESCESQLNIYEQLKDEAQIEKLYSLEEYGKAAELMQQFLDKYTLDQYEKGWFLQQMARYLYPIRKEESINIQKNAFKNNTQLLKPQIGIEYTKASFINENRMKRIRDYLCDYDNYEELLLSVSERLDNLSFGVDSEKFEAALKEIGKLLGFISQRPDAEIRKGPDNLWCGTNDEYAFFECKNEVDINRSEINKHEAAQMNSHCAWFESEYGKETKVARYLIIPTKNLSYEGDFTHDVRIIRKGKLRMLKRAIKSFISELRPYNVRDLNEETLQKLINLHKLNLVNVYEDYSETYYHSPN